MFTVRTQTVVGASPQEGFAFVADQTNAPRWQTGLSEVRRTTPGPIRVGTEHVFVRRFAGRRLEASNRFTRYDPPLVVEFEIPDGWLSGRASYAVQPHPAGSLLTSTVTLRARGPGRVLEPLLRRVLARDSRRDEQRLATLLGAG